MYCLSKMCYVCLAQKDRPPVNINRSLPANKDILHIIGYLPFNLDWLKTKRTILICEACCLRLRETYQFLALCLKNSALLQGYMDKLNTTSISNTESEAELLVDLNDKQNDTNDIKLEIKLEDEEKYTVEPIFEETEDVFVSNDESFVIEEDTWKWEEVDDKEESPMDNNSTASCDNDTDSEISVNSSAFTSTTNKKKPNTVAKKSHKCPTCSKSFSRNSALQNHTRVHTGEKPYKCAICEKCFGTKCNLSIHMRIHTGEKPYKCPRCDRSFAQQGTLTSHVRTHTGEKPYKCPRCDRSFAQPGSVAIHMRTHTGETPYKCSSCNKCFKIRSNLVRHMRAHTGYS